MIGLLRYLPLLTHCQTGFESFTKNTESAVVSKTGSTNRNMVRDSIHGVHIDGHRRDLAAGGQRDEWGHISVDGGLPVSLLRVTCGADVEMCSSIPLGEI